MVGPRFAFPSSRPFDARHPCNPPRELCHRRRAGRQTRGRCPDRDLLRGSGGVRGVRTAGRTLGRHRAFRRGAGSGDAARTGGRRGRRGHRRIHHFRHGRGQGLGQGQPRGPRPRSCRAFRGAWPARSCAGACQQARHRDRGGARLRDRPSRHHARLPAVARPRAEGASAAARARPRHRHRRVGDRRGESAAGRRAGKRYRSTLG